MIDGPSESSSGGVETPKQTRLVHVVFLGTPLYEEPDEASRVLAYLNKSTLLEILDHQGRLVRVRTADGAVGYVKDGAVLLDRGLDRARD